MQSGDQYLVAWQSDQDTGGTDFAICARYLNGDAIPGNVYMVVDTTLPQVQVDVAADASGQRYLLAWQDKYTNLKYGVWARGAYPDETMPPDFEVIPPGSGANREFPVVSGGRASYLVAWEHQRSGGGNRDIHGRLLRYVVYLPAMRRQFWNCAHQHARGGCIRWTSSASRCMATDGSCFWHTWPW